jgi:hypothetical protein
MVSVKDLPKRRATTRRLAQTVDWIALRRAYIERAERPRIEELGTEFGVDTRRIVAASSNEGWSLLRAKRLDAELARSDATLAILSAAKADGVLTRRASDLALQMMDRISELASGLENWKSLNTRANTLNTCSFALANLAKALKDLGVVGLPKVLKEQADAGNGRWSPQMLAALNVTIQNVQKADGTAVAGTVDVDTGDPNDVL